MGTGKLVDSSDMSNSQVQTMYAIKDGTKTAPYTSTTLPPTFSFPLGRSSLQPVTDLTTGVTVPASKIGWLYDLTGGVGSGSTERITFPLVANAGVIAWVGNTPSTSPCAPGVSGRVYAVNYDTGKTILTVSPTTPVPYVSDVFGLVKVQFIKIGDRVVPLMSDRSGGLSVPPSTPGGAAQPPRRLNWRALLN